MNTSELGVYILGATALAILAAAALVLQDRFATIAVAIAAGSAYASQFAGAMFGLLARDPSTPLRTNQLLEAANLIGIVISVVAWLAALLLIAY